MAILLAQSGLSAAAIEKMPAQTLKKKGRDGRTTAISFASRQLLAGCGVWDRLQTPPCPIQDIAIYDENAPVRLDFQASELGDQPFGWIVDNMDLLNALITQAEGQNNLDIYYDTHVQALRPGASGKDVVLDNGDVVTAQLVIAADGRQSFIRAHLDIPTIEHDYEQTALVGTITHEKPHRHLAIEHFRHSGPFAVLPMNDDADGRHRSTMIWTVEREEADGWQDCQPETLWAAVQTRLGDHFGLVEDVKLMGAWPLSLNYAIRTTAERVVLIADAAHGMHPIAGQGLNMSLRDVAALSRIIPTAHRQGKDIGGAAVLRQFVRERRLDNAAMIGATHGLNTLFGIRLKSVGLIRNIGLGLVQAVRPAKHFFMAQAMGLGSLPSQTISPTPIKRKRA